MEGRPNRVRGGSWKRGGGSNDRLSSGENRGRGRGHHRGRGKRDHYRGRGRGGGAPASGFHRDQDEGNVVEDEGMEEIFTRRKLESNWERYKESEKAEINDDTPAQRGTDFQVLLESAGDSFTQFRFSEEKEWEMDSLAANLISAVFVDLPALAERLQELPLYQRLNLEAKIVQESTPVDLPTMTMVPKQDVKSWFKPTVPAQQGPISSLGVSCAASPVSDTAPLGSSSAAKPLMDDMENELNQLLSLQSPVSEPSGSKPIGVMEEEEEEEEVEEVCVPDKPSAEERDEQVSEKQEEVQKEAPPKAEAAKQQMTEDDLEDWLDSMIS